MHRVWRVLQKRNAIELRIQCGRGYFLTEDTLLQGPAWPTSFSPSVPPSRSGAQHPRRCCPSSQVQEEDDLGAQEQQQLQGTTALHPLPAVFHSQTSAAPYREPKPSVPTEGLAPSSPDAPGSLVRRGAAVSGELWFVALLALLALLLGALALSLLLQRKLREEPYVRERPPLQPPNKREAPLSGHPVGSVSMFDSVADIMDVASSVTLKSYTVHLEGLTSARVSRAGTPNSLRSTQSISVLQIPSQRQASGRVSPPGTLRRSVSQFLDVQDQKALVDSALWEAILGHGSGLYVDEEDLMKAIKGFSSVTKEHTTFTDTQL